MARLSYEPEVRLIRKRYRISCCRGDLAREIRRYLEHMPGGARLADIDHDEDAIELLFECEEEENTSGTTNL